MSVRCSHKKRTVAVAYIKNAQIRFVTVASIADDSGTTPAEVIKAAMKEYPPSAPQQELLWSYSLGWDRPSKLKIAGDQPYIREFRKGAPNNFLSSPCDGVDIIEFVD